MTRIATAALLCAPLAGCILMSDPLPPPSVTAPASSILSRVGACAQAYAVAQLNSIATATEIAQAAAVACAGEEARYGDAFLTEHSWGADELTRLTLRRTAVDSAAELARKTALRAIVEARKAPQPEGSRSADVPNDTAT